VTVAIAACLPLQPPGGGLGWHPDQSAVVLATDSRFSIVGGDGKKQRHDDQGRKLYVLGPDAALVFTGDVGAGQRVVSDLLDYKRRRRNPPLGDPARAASLLIRQAFERRKGTAARQMAQRRLDVLIGERNPVGIARIAKYSDVDGFRCRFSYTVEAVGSRAACTAFRNELQALLTERFLGGRWSLDPVSDQVFLVAALRNAIRAPGAGDSVGGLVQTVLITKEGVNQLTFSSTSGDPMDPSSWETATIPVEETRQFRPAR
jgi:hypothetical protein